MAAIRSMIAASLGIAGAALTACHQQEASKATAPHPAPTSARPATSLPSQSLSITPPTSAAAKAVPAAFMLDTGLKLLAISTPSELQSAYPSAECQLSSGQTYCDIKPVTVDACGQEVDCEEITYIFNSHRLTGFLASYSEDNWKILHDDMIRHYGKAHVTKNSSAELSMGSIISEWDVPGGKFSMAYFFGSDLNGNPIKTPFSGSLTINTDATSNYSLPYDILTGPPWKSSEYIQCEDKGISMVDMRNCLGQERDRRNIQLHRAFETRLKDQYISGRAQMIAREQSWEKLRNADCEAEMLRDGPEPTAAGGDKEVLCEIQLTIDRISHLSRTYD